MFKTLFIRHQSLEQNKEFILGKFLGQVQYLRVRQGVKGSEVLHLEQTAALINR